jgi:hypothetical protein
MSTLTFFVEKNETNFLNRGFPKYAGNLLQRSMWWGHVVGGGRDMGWAHRARARIVGGESDRFFPLLERPIGSNSAEVLNV